MAPEDQIREQGIHYPVQYDIAYRTGYVMQTAGLFAFGVMYLLRSPFHLYPFLLFEAGVALSSLFLLVWNRNIKRFILASLATGIAIQVLSAFMPPGGLIAPERVFALGLGFILVAGAGLTGKEAYCFKFSEGWLILLIYPLAVLPNVFFTSHFYNVFVTFVLAALHLSFLRKKLSQPLLKGCEAKGCKPGEKAL